MTDRRYSWAPPPIPGGRYGIVSAPNAAQRQQQPTTIYVDALLHNFGSNVCALEAVGRHCSVAVKGLLL